jgi:hypothetical protein
LPSKWKSSNRKFLKAYQPTRINDSIVINSTTSFRPEIRFRYTFSEREYESDLLRPTIIARGYASAEKAAKELAPFHIGAKALAHVDPQHPDKAFLKKKRLPARQCS